MPASYDDAFDGSGFSLGSNYCSAAPLPQRTYVLTLTKRSIVLMSLINGKVGEGSIAGIGISGVLCGYDASFVPGASYSTSSTSCFKKLDPGTYIFNFCIADGSVNGAGSIVVIPNE